MVTRGDGESRERAELSEQRQTVGSRRAQARPGRAERGLPERGPVGIGGRVPEWVAGSFAAAGALAAWRSARSTGRGLHLDLSVFEAMFLVMTQYYDLNSQFHGG